MFLFTSINLTVENSVHLVVLVKFVALVSSRDSRQWLKPCTQFSDIEDLRHCPILIFIDFVCHQDGTVH